MSLQIILKLLNNEVELKSKLKSINSLVDSLLVIYHIEKNSFTSFTRYYI